MASNKPCILCKKTYDKYPSQTNPICEPCQKEENDLMLKRIKSDAAFYKMTFKALSSSKAKARLAK